MLVRNVKTPAYVLLIAVRLNIFNPDMIPICEVLTAFITIIIACFASFGGLTYFISTTKENIDLTAEVKKLQLALNTQKQK